MQDIASHRWGQGATSEWFLPSRAGSPQLRQAVGRFERMAISPSSFLRMARLIRDIDVRDVLPAIRVPTLVIQRRGDRINPPFYGRYIAEHIPGARYFEQPGDHVLRFAEAEELDAMFAEIEDILASSRSTPELTRALTTIMRAEGITETDSVAHIRAHGGSLRSHTVDCVLATFDAPGKAVRCALALRYVAAAEAPALRIGIHTGEVDLVGNQIAGPSVSIAERVSKRAEAGEILVSRTVKDLLVGSGIKFADRGSHQITAGNEPWALFTVVPPPS
jgi:hypothetical protein